jgi:hypothetical protein
MKPYKESAFSIIKSQLGFSIVEISTQNKIGDIFRLHRDAAATLDAHLIWLEKMGVSQ